MTTLDIFFSIAFFFMCIFYVSYIVFLNHEYKKHVYDYHEKVLNRLDMITTALDLYDGDIEDTETSAGQSKS